jgi:hypothetical protein
MRLSNPWAKAGGLVLLDVGGRIRDASWTTMGSARTDPVVPGI